MQKDTLEGISEDILSTFESVAQRLDLLDACDAANGSDRECAARINRAHIPALRVSAFSPQCLAHADAEPEQV